MFDGALRRMTGPALDACGRAIARTGLGADQVTIIGFSIGIAGAGAIAFGHFIAGLFLIVLNRAADGLDGAVARATRLTDRGGFLDITLDFFFYAAVPVAFAIADPGRNSLAAAILLAVFSRWQRVFQLRHHCRKARHSDGGPGPQVDILRCRACRRSGDHRCICGVLRPTGGHFPGFSPASPDCASLPPLAA